LQFGSTLRPATALLAESESEDNFKFSLTRHQPLEKMSDLAWAVKNGDMDQVRELVENKGLDVNTNIDGRLPLHYASDYGQLEVIKYLCKKGAKVNADDKHGISPLLAAVWEGHTTCVKFLLENGAARDGKTPDGSSYVEAAEKQEIKELLTN